ncbi:MAG: hypothetical protein WDM96_08565 [Lacunisphaera sp.]
MNGDAGADLELQNVIFNTGGLYTLYKSGSGVPYPVERLEHLWRGHGAE